MSFPFRYYTVQASVPSGQTRTGTTRAAVNPRSHPTRDPQRMGTDAPTRSLPLSHTHSFSSRSPVGIRSCSPEPLSGRALGWDATPACELAPPPKTRTVAAAAPTRLVVPPLDQSSPPPPPPPLDLDLDLDLRDGWWLGFR
jgi:hypothetical protein